MLWEDCKRILRENFSNLQTKTHASVHLIAKAQWPEETLQEYIYQFLELVKMVTGLKPQQVTDPLKIIIFNKHLFQSNQEICCKGLSQEYKGSFW